jgi:adenosylhomocysteinase
MFGLEPLRDRLKLPILVISDSPVKQFAGNEHTVGQSALESYLRLTNRVTNGEQVTVFGYGACGRGVAASFRGARGRAGRLAPRSVTSISSCVGYAFSRCCTGPADLGKQA